MRIISKSEIFDIPYDGTILEAPGMLLQIMASDGSWITMGTFDTHEEALREMRRIRRAYEAGAKYYIIGTGDHDGPMEVR